MNPYVAYSAVAISEAGVQRSEWLGSGRLLDQLRLAARESSQMAMAANTMVSTPSTMSVGSITMRQCIIAPLQMPIRKVGTASSSRASGCGGDIEADANLRGDEQSHDAEHEDDDADAGGRLLRVVAGTRHVMAGAGVRKGLGRDGDQRAEQNIGHGCKQLVLHNYFFLSPVPRARRHNLRIMPTL